MLNQNYMKILKNPDGTVTVACGEPNENPLDSIKVSSITLSPDDLIPLSDALKDAANILHDEESHG